MVDTSLAGLGLFGPVGAELDHLLGAATRHGANQLAGEEDLEDGGVEPDGDDLAGEVSTGGDLLVADPDEAAGRHPTGDLGGADDDALGGLDGRGWDRCRGLEPLGWGRAWRWPGGGGGCCSR
jgi:hypothetical protein